MEPIASVSKGIFLFPNGFKRSIHSKKKSRRTLFQTIFNKEPWYLTYKKNWDVIEDQIKELHSRTYNVLLNDVVSYIKSFYGENDSANLEGIIPSATLLTGVNQPDHVSQFTTLVNKIRDEVTPHVALINSQDATLVKHLVENAVWQLIYGQSYFDEDDFNDSITQTKKLKKSQCTMKALQNWYRNKYIEVTPKKKKYTISMRSLVIIIPDFECFNCNVLQDFVMILSSYISTVPVMFVFGVATSVSALHKSFPYHVSSKLLIKVFQSHSSPVYMNEVLENVFLTHTSPFHLLGKALELLTDVFLFYDFSVSGLIQSIKYCMMEHFYGDNIKSLCCARNKIEDVVVNLSAEDLENIRRLLSFRPFLEAQDCETKIALFEDDIFFRNILCKEMHKLHDYLYSFYICVRLLSVFVKDLPKNIFGKTIREIYTKCAVENVPSTQAFRELMQLLNFQSQVKLVENIKLALKVINSALQNSSPVKPLRASPTKNNLNNIALKNELGEKFVKTVRIHLIMFSKQIENANTEATIQTCAPTESQNYSENVAGNRYKLKEKLFRAAKIDKIQSEFEMIRARFVSYLEEMFKKGLQPPHTQTFHEILFFGDVASIKKQIVGSPRGAIHMALSNPGHYLQCSCCRTRGAEGGVGASVAGSAPSVCVAYNLHRECGAHINLYDWLQAFAAILTLHPDDEQAHHDPRIRLKFMQAVAELQFLGFIKASKRKTDHVMRLTW